MLHPTYTWITFNWYTEYWWKDNSSCIRDGSVKIEDLERVLKTSLIVDHYPRIEDEHADEPNVGKIVSNLYNYYCK